MSKPGLSPDTFIERVQDVGSIVEHWPFGHMPDHEPFIGQHSVISEHPFRSRDRNALLIGQIGLLEGDLVSMNTIGRNREDDTRLHLAIESDDAAAAWSQMAGVHVSLEAELRSRGGTKITRIRGIEQPIYPPATNGTYINKRASRDSGYVQGIVERDIHDIYGMSIFLAIGRSLGTAIVTCQFSAVVGRSESHQRGQLTAGDTVRIPAVRSGDMYSPDYFIGDKCAYLLPGKLVEQ